MKFKFQKKEFDMPTHNRIKLYQNRDCGLKMKRNQLKIKIMFITMRHHYENIVIVAELSIRTS